MFQSAESRNDGAGVLKNRPAFLSLRSSTPFITFVIAYAVFTDQFLFAAVLPVAPFALQERLHIPEDRVQYWVALLLGVYGIACFVSSPPWGWYSDRSQSRRTPWLLGLFVLLGATILLWLAPNNAVSILGRVLQGLASTVIWTTGLAIMVDTVSEKRVGEYMGYVGIALNLGTLVAPLAGGMVFAKAGYNAVFIVAFAVIGVDVVLRLIMIERSVADVWIPDAGTTQASECDIENNRGEKQISVRSESCLSFMTYQTAWTPPESLQVLSTDKDAVKAEHAGQATGSSLPAVLTLLWSCRFLSAIWGIFVQASIYSGLEAVLPLVVHRLFDWTSTGGGLVFLPFMAPALLGPLVGKFSDRFGPRWLATAGFVLLCPSLVLLRLVDHDSAYQKALLCVLLAMIGFCLTLTLEPLMAEITYLGGHHDTNVKSQGREKKVGSYAQAYALFNMAWAAGNTVGPFWAGLVVQHAGWKTMSWSLGLLGGVSALPTLLWCGGWVFSRQP